MSNDPSHNQHIDSDSDPDDVDYVPEIASESEDEINDIDSNDDSNDNEDDSGSVTRHKRRKKSNNGGRGSKKSKLDASSPEKGTEDKVDGQVILERKKKVESIWEEMNKPVSVSSSTSQKLGEGNQVVKSNDKTDTQDTPNEKAERKTSGSSSLTASTLPKNLVSSPPSTSATAASTSSNANPNSQPSIHPNIEKPKRRPGPAKRSSGLSALASKYGVDLGPAKKLNTLEKSKQDWNKFVDKEGIKDELQYKNKDGYLEKVDFLKRMDEVQDQKIRELKKGSTSKR